MAKDAFDRIAGGLKDAIAHARGSDARGKIRRVKVPSVSVGAVREKLGLSQEDFAAAFGVSLGTVRNWEQGRRQPEGPARALLAVIAKEPRAVLTALGVGRPKRKVA